MIIDKLKNSDTYYALGERFKTAFEYLKNTDIQSRGRLTFARNMTCFLRYTNLPLGGGVLVLS